METKRTDEFRADAVRIALTSGLTRTQLASDLGVGLSTLNKWVTTNTFHPASLIRVPSRSCVDRHHPRKLGHEDGVDLPCLGQADNSVAGRTTSGCA